MRSRGNMPSRVVGATLTIGVMVTLLVTAAALAERNGTLPAPLPLFPVDNWWNQNISQAPVDPRSAQYISFIGATDGLHPDFGGTESPGSQSIYGMPYVVVGADQPKVTVRFDYDDQSDGVNHQTGESYPFYPIPAEAITEPYWIEGGLPGNANVGGDRHMLIVDRDNRHLYELFALRWTGSRWEAGSGAFFDLNTNARRPEGWTSADAAGLAILPGLVRYDEVFGPDEIRHALRVTVHGVDGYVWPASHRANTNSAGPPLGTRLRLKASTNTSGYPPYIQKIFRAMKTYGLIVADTGSDMYVSGAFDTRWSNDELNPAFHAIKAGDFEIIELGWRGDTGPCEPPGPPVSFTGGATGVSASFTWAAPGSGGALTDYLLEAGRSPGASDAVTVAVSASATSFAANGAPGTYYVRLRARNACGTAVSEEVTLTLSSACALPFPPGQPVGAVAESTVAVSWPAAANASAHVFEAGSLPRAANLLNLVLSGTSLGVTAPPGVYFVRARGQNACGTGAPSADTMIQVGCSAPGNASPLTASVAGDQVTLQWNAAAAAIDYVVEAGTASGAGNVASIPRAGTSLVAQAPPGIYYVRVRPRNACGSGWWSNEVVVTVPR